MLGRFSQVHAISLPMGLASKVLSQLAGFGSSLLSNGMKESGRDTGLPMMLQMKKLKELEYKDEEQEVHEVRVLGSFFRQSTTLRSSCLVRRLCRRS